VAPVATTVLGVLGFWLSPLKQRVYDFLYPPSALITFDVVSLRSPMMRGDTFVLKLHVIPGNSSSLTPGEIRANVPNDYLVLEDGNVLTDFDGSEKAKIVTYKFDTVKAGTPRLTYVYSFARGGSITRDVELNVIDRVDGFPTFGDISGQWELVWEKGLGELNITQQDKLLTGSFSLAEIDNNHVVRGKLKGFAVGDNIHLVFSPDQPRASDKTATAAIYANLLKVSGPHDLTICGHVNTGKDEPFIGEVIDASASVQEVCKGANLRARAQVK
jgi:hypothetical protein